MVTFRVLFVDCIAPAVLCQQVSAQGLICRREPIKVYLKFLIFLLSYTFGTQGIVAMNFRKSGVATRPRNHGNPGMSGNEFVVRENPE